MSTPIQSVPSSYQQEVNISGGSTNQQLLDQSRAQVKDYSNRIETLSGRIAALNRTLQSSRDMSAEQRKRMKAQLDSLLEKRQGFRTKKAQSQEAVYIQSGQYEKLLGGADRDAFSALRSMFMNMGLGTLAGKIYDYVKNGYSADTITILLQDTKEYKERFKGNEARQAAGLPVLSPAEYLSVEASYQQIMQSAGLPKGFYDNPADFRQWIGKNISPSEIQERVDLATQAVQLSNPEYRAALKQMGIREEDLTAYFLDSKKALPALQEAAAIAATGAEAIEQGLTFDAAYSERLVQQGITQQEASQGYSIIAQELGTLQALGSMYGMEWQQRQSEQAILEQEGSALKAREELIGRERGTFGGAVGSARAGLAQSGGAR